MRTLSHRSFRLAFALLLALPLLACGNKGPLTLAPRPEAAPTPVIAVDVAPAQVDADAMDDAPEHVPPPRDDDPR